MQLSKKQTTCSDIFPRFFKHRLSFERFRKKMTLIADVFSE